MQQKPTNGKELIMTTKNIRSLLIEDRLFDPPAEFQASALINSEKAYDQMWKHSAESPESFWDEQAKDLLTWFKPYDSVLKWKAPYAKWFEGGKINASYQCLDRHLLTDRRTKPAIIWEGEPGDSRTLTFEELHADVCTFANGLKKLGIQKGDRVTIYMPMVPELAIAVLACARIGAVHSVVFGGFSAEAIADRNNDAKAKLIITADGGFRRGKPMNLKGTVDSSLENSPTVENVVVYQRTKEPVNMKAGRDIWWHDLVDDLSSDCPAEELDSEHPLFLLYTSGSTGKPKGILHSTAGYMLGTTISSKYVFDLKEDDVFWCTADIGWVTGHSYIVYGPLSNGATTVMYEGTPSFPDWGRFWSIIEKYKVTTFYTAPTAIRSFIKEGAEYPEAYDLSSLRLLGSVGEPINPEAWIWYKEKIGKNKCPIVDTWWQTETGSIMMSPLPGVTPTKPGSCAKPFFGVVPQIVDKEGNEVEDGHGGFLVLKNPWPSMLRTVYGDDQRYRDQYWSQIPGKYFTGDGARKDKDGYFWILGRIDDVLNVSGHRLSTMEIESALVSHSNVTEAAVVGAPHDIKGECIHCFVTLEKSSDDEGKLKIELEKHVVKHIGAIARPESIRFTDVLPKTRSGKIMRRLLRDIAAGRDSNSDTSGLEDSSVLDTLRKTDS